MSSMPCLAQTKILTEKQTKSLADYAKVCEEDKLNLVSMKSALDKCHATACEEWSFDPLTVILFSVLGGLAGAAIASGSK